MWILIKWIISKFENITAINKKKIGMTLYRNHNETNNYLSFILN